MPKISLVVCLYKERAWRPLLRRPPLLATEPHWPFAWSVSRHNWILRLDADEFPSEEMQTWLKHFRQQPEPDDRIPGYTCIWPLWNGRSEGTHNIPEWRPIFFQRDRVKFFGLAEQGPFPDVKWEKTGLILHHRPKRKSYGVENLLFRRQAYVWRKVIADSLRGTPLDLPRWRYDTCSWPPYWEEIRRRPLMTGFKRFLLSLPREYLYMRRSGFDFIPEAALGTALHKFLVPLAFAYYKVKSDPSH